MHRDMFPRTLCALALAGGLAAVAEAKVVFTGYADFRITPQSNLRLLLPPSIAATAGLANARYETRTATLDSVGLFAANSLSEHTEFLVDVTWRNIGYNAQTTRLQYAYLLHMLGSGTEVRAGKITLPFGHVNQHRFYSFQQASVTPPVFLSGILGLPISDLGVSIRHVLALGPVTARATGFAVNGYGPVPGSRTTFRSVTLPGGLTIANNLGAGDANKKPAGGGRLVLSSPELGENEVGGSYYAGHWDAAGRRLLQMANAHALVSMGPVDLLAEYLYMQVEDDAGFGAILSSRNWRTDGALATLRWNGLEVLGRRLTPWARGEEYRSRGPKGGNHERLRGYAAGVALDVDEGVTVKLEANQLKYGLPFTGGGRLELDGISYVLGLSVSF